MLTDEAIAGLEEIHRGIGADPRVILSEAKELMYANGGLSACDCKVLAPGTRSGFFEMWAPFWLLPQELCGTYKRSLGASMLASWVGIAQIDHSVDERADGGQIYELLRCQRRALLWDRAVHNFLACETNWPNIVRVWSSEKHGILPEDDARDIVLKKNPFYPEVFRVYMGETAARELGVFYTLMVGLMDEAADVADDLNHNRPNYILKEFGLTHHDDPRAAINTILSERLIEQTLSTARASCDSIAAQAADYNLLLFSMFINFFKQSFVNYEEFCIGRAITSGARRF